MEITLELSCSKFPEGSRECSRQNENLKLRGAKLKNQIFAELPSLWEDNKKALVEFMWRVSFASSNFRLHFRFSTRNRKLFCRSTPASRDSSSTESQENP